MIAVRPAAMPTCTSLRNRTETEREHQQNDAEPGKRLDDLPIGHQRDRDVRPNDQSRKNVTEHDRLP
jgi:hypothetical protein